MELSQIPKVSCDKVKGNYADFITKKKNPKNEEVIGK